MTIVTPIRADQLTAIFPAAVFSRLQLVAAELNADPVAFGLDTAQRRAHFFAQLRQESGPGLEPQAESLAYSPAALIATFSYYRNHPDEAHQDGYMRDEATRKVTRPAAQQTIANYAYANRNGNGGPASGDGWRYRGRGFLQVTGRANYTAIAAQCRKLYPATDVDFVAQPEQLETLTGALRSAVGYWTLNGLHRLADRGATDADVDRITAVINKHTDSYAARRAHFALALRGFTRPGAGEAVA